MLIKYNSFKLLSPIEMKNLQGGLYEPPPGGGMSCQDHQMACGPEGGQQGSCMGEDEYHPDACCCSIDGYGWQCMGD
jgi:hypothetical protein